jgi:hypothetical protein
MSDKQQEKVFEVLDRKRQIEMSIPEGAQNRKEIKSLIEKRKDLLIAMDEDTKVDPAIDPALAPDNKQLKANYQARLNAIDDAIKGLSSGKGVVYSKGKTEGTYEAQFPNGEVKKITEEQYKFAETEKLNGIVFANTLSEQVAGTDEDASLMDAPDMPDFDPENDIDIEMEMDGQTLPKMKSKKAYVQMKKHYEHLLKVKNCLTS